MAARTRTDKRQAVSQPIILDDVAQPIRQAKGDSPIDAFKRQLRDYVTLADWNGLCLAGCSEERLWGYLMALQMAFQLEGLIHNDPVRKDARWLRSLVDKTSSVAREWEQVFRSSFGEAVLASAVSGYPSADPSTDPSAGRVKSAREEFTNVPRRLLLLADSAKKIHRGSKHQRRPLYDDNLAELTEYVKSETGNYHDREVSALVAFVIDRRYEAGTLLVWRSQHPDTLEHARLRLSRHRG